MSNLSNKRRKLKQQQKKRKLKHQLRYVSRIVMIIVPIIVIIIIGSIIRNIWKSQPDTTASVLSAGDVIMHGPFLKSNEYKQDDGSYDYNSIFTHVKDNYNASDFTIVNFESTITSNENDYTSYPMFRAPDAIAAALSENGVDMTLLANNHIYDNFAKGISMTTEAMDENSIICTGAVSDSSDQSYLIQDVNGIKIGIINYTAETDKTDAGERTINAITVEDDDIDLINTFNYDELPEFYDELELKLEEMKGAGAEYTIAYLHWGNEYETTENEQQREIAQKLCDMGIDALIGGHPHVIQPVDLLEASSGDHKMLCVYSVGNHMANQHKARISSSPDGHTEDGIMVNLVLEKTNGGDVSLVKAEFIPTWTYRTVGVTDDQNPEFYIFPLNDPEKAIQNAKEISGLDIKNEVNDSLERTDEIIGEGVEKIEKALPLS